MRIQPTYKYSFISFGLLLLWALLVFLLFYSEDDNRLLSNIEVFVAWYLTFVVGIAIGLALVLYRIMENSKKPSAIKNGFFYNFFATLNMSVGLLGAILFTISYANGGGFIISLLFGILMYHDIYFSKKVNYR